MTNQKIIETASNVISTSTRTTLGASGASILGWFANLDLIAAIGVCLGLGSFLISFAGFCVNFHYKRKEDLRAEKLHKLEVEKLMQ
ncbi:holin [Acinetobacter sp. HY1485]|uniref:holin n=1 Tax=Acinetobacter sp. HY1485 TaxID=2970918 RepID=UPI0022B99C4F|nr:holin [Acinetobacter sp. HY1485]